MYWWVDEFDVFIFLCVFLTNMVKDIHLEQILFIVHFKKTFSLICITMCAFESLIIYALKINSHLHLEQQYNKQKKRFYIIRLLNMPKDLDVLFEY
jgi:hypothetical protein